MAQSKRALITGITGQDGSYLAEFLLKQGYTVSGMVRRSSSERMERIEHLLGQVSIVHGDLTDLASIIRVVDLVKPHEIYNLAAMSYVPTSWQEPVLTCQITALGVTNVLEAIRIVNKDVRFYQASSSEMFGKVRESPQSEKTPHYPRSPYGVAKVYGHWITVNYRESYGIFGCSGILFNHESPRRGTEFVTRKVTNAAARIKLGLQESLQLGNLDSRRDWGFAGDYVRAMWLMLQQEQPGDFVIATGISHSVREMVEIAFQRVGLDWQEFVKVDQSLIRPAEVDILVGDASRARKDLGWTPEVNFRELIEMMVDSDVAVLRKQEKEAEEPVK